MTPPTKNRKPLIGVVGAAVATALIAFTAPQEGVSLTPYQDKLANNLLTVCYGETRVAMRAYTMPECKAMLSDGLADYAEGVKEATPGFETLTVGQQVAAIDFAYNAGIGNYKASTLRKRYIARDFPGACYEYMRWTKVNGGKTDCADPKNRCMGIWTRRIKARDMCLGVAQ